MVRMQIGKNNPNLENLLYILGGTTRGKTLHNTEEAMENAAIYIQGAWVEVAKEISRSGGYARSIQREQTGTFEYEIFSEAKIADIIENGSHELDMKKTHPYGPRSRVARDIISKKTGKILRKGYPYLIVPIKWGTEDGTVRVGPKNIVPKQLLKLMLSKRFKASTERNETYQSPNERGEMVDRSTYTWGGRAKGSDFAGTIEQKRFADGMVRFEEESAADRPGGKRYGGYFTFRIISARPGAKGWIRREQPARHITRMIAEETRENVNALVESGIMKDLANL
jgi:hypothetical protein